jgi:hypothetical protein
LTTAIRCPTASLGIAEVIEGFLTPNRSIVRVLNVLAFLVIGWNSAQFRRRGAPLGWLGAAVLATAMGVRRGRCGGLGTARLHQATA